MFYHCAKYQFSLPRPTLASGGVVAASALPRMQLLLRQRKLVQTHPHLAHRMLDPQLYLCGVPSTSKAVQNLATYPWFGVPNPPFSTSQHLVKEWMAQHEAELVANWTCKVPSTDEEIEAAVRSCVELQLQFGVEALLLPSPLTTMAGHQYELETRYLDAAAEVCGRARIQVPIFATVAFSDQVVRGTDPSGNPLLSTITAQIASRDFIQGAYLILEQSNEHGHCYACEEGCFSLLMMADDLSRGAGKRVVVNYLGMFGLISMAAGTSVWASGHYRSHRRFRLADQEEERGSAMPRLYSLGLLGDVGVEDNAALIYASSHRDHVLYETRDSRPLYRAFAAGRSSSDVPAWRYRQGNIKAAAAHYYQTCKDADDLISACEQGTRVRLVEKWLERAVRVADDLRQMRTLETGSHTDLGHQKVWLNAYRKWRSVSGL